MAEVLSYGSVLLFAFAILALCALALHRSCCAPRDTKRRSPPRRREADITQTPVRRPLLFDNGPSTIKRKLEDFFGQQLLHDSQHGHVRNDPREESVHDACNETFGRPDRRHVQRRRAVV